MKNAKKKKITEEQELEEYNDKGNYRWGLVEMMIQCIEVHFDWFVSPRGGAGFGGEALVGMLIFDFDQFNIEVAWQKKGYVAFTPTFL